VQILALLKNFSEGQLVVDSQLTLDKTDEGLGST
jgi:hypothetical protein